MSKVDFEKIQSLLTNYSFEERAAAFMALRAEFPIHELETLWNTTAEVILEAIARSSDLTKRGVRGVIAEASFKQHIVNRLLADGWEEKGITGDKPFDFHLKHEEIEIRIQVKMQRQKAHRPMLASEASKTLFGDKTDMWVVETQRTRGGKSKSGDATRPYRFGEFDILAVSLHPSGRDWSRFIYTVASRLIPDPHNDKRIFKYQPVPRTANNAWTEDLLKCIEWFKEYSQHQAT